MRNGRVLGVMAVILVAKNQGESAVKPIEKAHSNGGSAVVGLKDEKDERS